MHLFLNKVLQFHNFVQRQVYIYGFLAIDWNKDKITRQKINVAELDEDLIHYFSLLKHSVILEHLCSAFRRVWLKSESNRSNTNKVVTVGTCKILCIVTGIKAKFARYISLRHFVWNKLAQLIISRHQSK